MPSFEHGLLVQLFRSQPELAPRLLASSLAVPLPAASTAAIAESTLDPLASAELRADLVVELRDAAGALTYSVVVEVQLARDPAKRLSWPLYLALLRARSRCPVALLVIAPDPSVAAWAAETIEIGPGASITPLVLGPSRIPRIADPGEAARYPGLAVLSARVHGRGRGGEELAPALAAAISSVDRAVVEVYLSYIYEALDAAARRALEELVMAFDVSQIDPNWRFEDTEFGKRLPELYLEQQRRKAVAEGLAEGLEKGLEKGLEQGLEKGLEQGLEQGLEKGLEQGLEQGRILARRELLVRLAGHAGVAFDDEQRARIEACTDTEALDRWIDRAIEAKSAEEILS